jgi:hypothetical protein
MDLGLSEDHFSRPVVRFESGLLGVTLINETCRWLIVQILSQVGVQFPY